MKVGASIKEIYIARTEEIIILSRLLRETDTFEAEI